jgi:hypothetical protein
MNEPCETEGCEKSAKFTVVCPADFEGSAVDGELGFCSEAHKDETCSNDERFPLFADERDYLRYQPEDPTIVRHLDLQPVTVTGRERCPSCRAVGTLEQTSKADAPDDGHSPELECTDCEWVGTADAEQADLGGIRCVHPSQLPKA